MTIPFESVQIESAFACKGFACWKTSSRTADVSVDRDAENNIVWERRWFKKDDPCLIGIVLD